MINKRIKYTTILVRYGVMSVMMVYWWLHGGWWRLTNGWWIIHAWRLDDGEWWRSRWRQVIPNNIQSQLCSVYEPRAPIATGYTPSDIRWSTSLSSKSVNQEFKGLRHGYATCGAIESPFSGDSIVLAAVLDLEWLGLAWRSSFRDSDSKILGILSLNT